MPSLRVSFLHYMFLLCRYTKLLLYFGLTPVACKDFKVQTFCKILAEFSLDYKTTKEKLHAQREQALMKAKEKQKLLKQQQQKKLAAVDVSLFPGFTAYNQSSLVST